MNKEKVKVFKGASGYSQVVNPNRKARIILYACSDWLPFETKTDEFDMS